MPAGCPAFRFSDAERDKYIAELSDANGSSAKVAVQRYKGLGEMDSEQLWETTMNPETRTIIKVTMEDAAKADEIISILMGDKVLPAEVFASTADLLAAVALLDAEFI